MIPTLALVLMGVSAALQAVVLLLGGERREPVSALLLLAAGLLLLGVTVERSLRIAFVAITNTYESLLFFSAAISMVAGVLSMGAGRRVPRFVTFGATVVGLALLMLSSSPALPKDLEPPIPALQSIWLVLHVTLSFIGEAFFVVSFVAAIVYLAARDERKGHDADRLMYTAIGIGYPIFTAGALVFGAVWAQSAWGSYWSWDPKETWALATWLVYTAYLHTRLVRRLRGKVSAVLAIAGFACTLFTFFGVNYLLPGLHSYG